MSEEIEKRYTWRKVKAPKRWNPKLPGESIVGFYGGKTVRDGNFGQYEIIIVHIPGKTSLMVSGTQLIQLVDASGIDIGWPIKVVWLGWLDLGETRRMKQFDVLVAEGDPVSPDELPKFDPPTPTTTQ